MLLCTDCCGKRYPLLYSIVGGGIHTNEWAGDARLYEPWSWNYKQLQMREYVFFQDSILHPCNILHQIFPRLLPAHKCERNIGASHDSLDSGSRPKTLSLQLPRMSVEAHQQQLFCMFKGFFKLTSKIINAPHHSFVRGTTNDRGILRERTINRKTVNESGISKIRYIPWNMHIP